jgi:hypothetical protein
MNEGFSRSIFRVDAVRRYAQGREVAVLPRFVSPPTWICLWILLGLLMAGGLVAWQCCRLCASGAVRGAQCAVRGQGRRQLSDLTVGTRPHRPRTTHRAPRTGAKRP